MDKYKNGRRDKGREDVPMFVKIFRNGGESESIRMCVYVRKIEREGEREREREREREIF